MNRDINFLVVNLLWMLLLIIGFAMFDNSIRTTSYSDGTIEVVNLRWRLLIFPALLGAYIFVYIKYFRPRSTMHKEKSD